jgi:hypothetical protein
MRPIILCLFLLLHLIVRGQTAAPPPAPSPPAATTTPPPVADSPAVRKGDFQTEYKMKANSYLGFGQVNLGMGEIGVKVVVFCENKAKASSRLEFRLDKPKGKKSHRVGSLKIPFTNDSTFSLKLTGNSKYFYGVHDIYLVAKGSGQFSITSISFILDY